jgi:FixJ family two-component response regulator
MPQDHIVYVVDDDDRIREAFAELPSSFDMHAVTFASAAEYMAFPKPQIPACLVLDVQLPDINGLELQKQMTHGDHPHVVFITGHGDIPSSVQAIKAGAVDFLTKPFDDAVLLYAIATALERSCAALAVEAELLALRAEYAALSQRQREVMALVTSGLLNKQVGGRLGISEITVKAHRGNVMRKMEARSLADLVIKAAKLGISPPPN